VIGSVYDTRWSTGVETEEICPACGGRGILPTPDRSRWQVCPICFGTGYIRMKRVARR